jgi:predicted nucleic acid-binding protein
MNFLDTNLIVRYLTNDQPEMAKRAARLIDSSKTLHVTDVVIAEAGFVLTSIYKAGRGSVVDSLVAFLQKSNIAVYGLDKGVILQALLLCGPSSRISFADAMLWAAARSEGNSAVYTLDARFPEDGLVVKEP